MFRVYKENGYDLSDGLTLTLNGQQVKARCCYVSKYPINCRWPGRQRFEDQRIENYFVSFESDEAVEVMIETDETKVRLKPYERTEQPRTENGKLKFTLKQAGGYALLLGDYTHAIHFFFNKPTQHLRENETGDVLYFGPGLHDVGILNLRSNQTVYIDEGGVVFGCIHAENAENIRILGKGTLDGSKTKEVILREIPLNFENTDSLNAKREHTIQLIGCNGIEIKDIVIKDSLLYNIATWDCKDLLVDNVKIIGCWRYNTDGIDLHNTSNATVQNCFVRTFDDSICVKGHLPYGTDCENITVKNCVVWNDWGNALHVGVEGCAEKMHNIVFEDSYVIRNTGSALNIGNVDYSEIYDVTYKNICVELDTDNQPCILQNRYPFELPNPVSDGSCLPPVFSLIIAWHHEYSVGEKRGKIHDVLFQNIRVLSPSDFKSGILGDEINFISDVCFQDITLNGKKCQTIESLHCECFKNATNIVVK